MAERLGSRWTIENRVTSIRSVKIFPPHPLVEPAGNSNAVSFFFFVTICSCLCFADCQLTANTGITLANPPLASKLANPDEFMLIGTLGSVLCEHV